MVESPRVLVVGGGLGIGEQVTEYLLKSHNARVVVLSLDISENLASQRNKNLKLITGDATQPSVIRETLKVVIDFMQGLDALVCTLGIMGEIQNLSLMSLEALRKTYEINVFAPIQLSQAFLPELRKSHGSIIILSSSVDQKIKYSGWIQYCSSKAALTRFIEVLGHEEPDVKVHGVYPGLTGTSMPRDIVNGKYVGIMKDFEVQKFAYWNEYGDIEPPEWCGSVVAAMASGSLAINETGQVKFYYEYDPFFKRTMGRVSKL